MTGRCHKGSPRAVILNWVFCMYCVCIYYQRHRKSPFFYEFQCSNLVGTSLKNPENLEFSGFFTIPIFLIHSVRPMPLFFFYILSIVSIFDSLYVKLKYTEYNCENGK